MSSVNAASATSSAASSTSTMAWLTDARSRAEGIATANGATLSEQPPVEKVQDVACFGLAKSGRGHLLSLRVGTPQGAFDRAKALSHWAAGRALAPSASPFEASSLNDAFAIALPFSEPLDPHEARQSDIALSLFTQLPSLHCEQPPIELPIEHPYPARARDAIGRLSTAMLQGTFPEARLLRLSAKLDRYLKPQARHSALVHGAFEPKHVFPYEPAATQDATYPSRSGFGVRFAERLRNPSHSYTQKYFYFTAWHSAHLGDPLEDVARFATYAGYPNDELKRALKAYMSRSPELMYVQQVQLYMTAMHIEAYVAALCRGDEANAAHWQERLLADEKRLGPSFGAKQWLATKICNR